YRRQQTDARPVRAAGRCERPQHHAIDVAIAQLHPRPASRLLAPAVDLTQVPDRRLRVQFLQSPIPAQRMLGAAPHHGAGGILQVAEGDGLCRARLHAGGDDLAVPHRAAVGLRIHLRRADALQAEGALLHHARATHGDVWIELEVERRRPVRSEPIEAAHLVRAVVAAVACADTAVVDLAVQPFLSMVGGVHRTDGLARRVVTLLAEHGHQGEWRSLRLPRHETLDPDPGHDAPARHLFLADDRDIVLRVAGSDAGTAAGAGVEIDRHPPLMLGVAVLGAHLVRLGDFPTAAGRDYAASPVGGTHRLRKGVFRPGWQTGRAVQGAP